MGTDNQVDTYANIIVFLIPTPRLLRSAEGVPGVGHVIRSSTAKQDVLPES